MADDNNKKKAQPKQQYTEEENKKYLQRTAYIPDDETLKERGIPNVGKPTRPGASADSSGYFARRVNALERMESDYINNKKVNIPKDIKERKVGRFDAGTRLSNVESGRIDDLARIRNAQEEAKDNFWRQQDKGDKGVILNYDKDGHFIGPFGGSKEAPKKEMKPAKIVAPVKRPVAAAQKKATGKK
jgi:hypothetical protein